MCATNKSTDWKELNSPLLLAPAGKDYLWGGKRLAKEYGKEIPIEPLAETWECSTHPDGLSMVASGAYKGKTLAEALKEQPQWIGSHPKGGAGLPVLIKFIDAKEDLSIQVHPNDEYALKHEGQLGKTEMWYVLEAEPNASLIYGFSHNMKKEQLLESLEQGTLFKHLQQVQVQKDDVFMIWPGTVHAIGGGVLLAEIQECSNVTYRLYDYDRTDKSGEKRRLHVNQAVQVLNMQEQPLARRQMRVMRYHPGSASEVLCRCEYFQVDRVLVTGAYQCLVEKTSFQVFLILKGSLKVGELSVKKGDCIFLPAGCGNVSVCGRGQLLKICC